MLFVFFFVFFSILYFNTFLLLKVILSCGIAIFLSSPTNNAFAKTILIIFNIYSPSFFSGCFLFWHGYSSIRNYFTVFNTELIKRFHRVRMVFLGICIVYIDKIYNLFYVLPFFDLVFQLLNRCSISFKQNQLSYGFVRFISVYIFFYIHTS